MTPNGRLFPWTPERHEWLARQDACVAAEKEANPRGHLSLVQDQAGQLSEGPQ